jgi:mono/diheme cytochrome c family protein
MLHRASIATLAALIGGCVACDSRYSSSAFHLPSGGDVDRGKAAFVELGCHSCHEVPGAGLPSPSVHPAVPVVLGGEVAQKFSDAYLVTSMLDPSYQLARYPRDQIMSGGKSRMPCYAGRMNTQQMIDIVAFIQSRYAVSRWSPQYVYY